MFWSKWKFSFFFSKLIKPRTKMDSFFSCVFLDSNLDSDFGLDYVFLDECVGVPMAKSSVPNRSVPNPSSIKFLRGAFQELKTQRRINPMQLEEYNLYSIIKMGIIDFDYIKAIMEKNHCSVTMDEDLHLNGRILTCYATWDDECISIRITNRRCNGSQ